MTEGVPGVTVQLWDSGGNVVATAKTDRNGGYLFNQLSGLSATGNYTVRLVVPSGFTQTSANPSPILISRGDINVSGVNFSVASSQQGVPTSGQQGTSYGGPSGTDRVLKPAKGRQRVPRRDQPQPR